MSKPIFEDTEEASFFLIILKGKNRTLKTKSLKKFPFVYTEMFRFNDVDLHINHRKNNEKTILCNKDELKSKLILLMP